MNTTADTTTTETAETVESVATEAMNAKHAESRTLSAILSTEWNRQSIEREALRAAQQVAQAADQVAEQIKAGQHTADFVSQYAHRLVEATQQRKELNERMSMLIHTINDDELRTRLAAAR